ncbi:Hsp70 family protein [Actinomadura sp. HBU206391]|uniref:Hsp70 family protein n=1 Tax=Actinomadura sp. HBU206391 TaxID=2731692 RepID=UPI0016505779|nr:Hsp70 family protein [Actinomadura sp. HBU206391]MBC6457026.1 Hsp70 family protein [Actinomadura sp. HBU206391]
MGLVYGVDFGTSNSAIMVGRPGGRVLRVRNPVQSLYEVPSAVCLRADGTMAVGSVATRMKLQRPAYFLDEFKRHVGDPIPHTFPPENPSVSAEGRAYPTYRLVAEVLGLLREQALLQVSGRPDLVVLTVPASWQESNRDHMRQAAEHAGFSLESVRLVTEPETAVAYALHEQLGLEERTLLVYDLGGGTFDCAVVRGRDHLSYTVLGEAGGLEDVGGAEFDRQILKLIAERFPEETERVLDPAARDASTLADRLKLLESCESIKRTLSAEERFSGVLTELGMNATFELTRADLAELLAPLLAETLRECTRVLEAAGLSWSDLDAVVPVGGSSRLPLVAETIARHTGADRVPVYKVDDPELAVAHGAVLHAYRLQAAARHQAPPPRPAPDDAIPTPANAPLENTAPENSATAVRDGGPATGDAAAPSGEAVPGPGGAASGDAVPAPSPAPSAGVVAADGSGTDAGDAPDTPPPPGSGERPAPVTFHAWNMRNVAWAWRWEHGAWFAAALTMIVAVVDFGDWFTSKDPGGLVTQGRLTMSVSALAAVSGVVMLIAARAFDRALLPWGGMVVAAGAMSGVAAIYHFLDGWPAKVGLAVLIVITVVAVVVAKGGVSSRHRYIHELTVDHLGITIATIRGRQRRIPWGEIRALELDRFRRLVAKPVSRPAALQYSPLIYSSSDDHLVLFSRHHFPAPDEVAGALRLHGGDRVGELWN